MAVTTEATNLAIQRGRGLARGRGVPLAGQALRFAEIVRGHLACSQVAIIDRPLPRLTSQP